LLVNLQSSNGREFPVSGTDKSEKGMYQEEGNYLPINFKQHQREFADGFNLSGHNQYKSIYT